MDPETDVTILIFSYRNITWILFYSENLLTSPKLSICYATFPCCSHTSVATSRAARFQKYTSEEVRTHFRRQIVRRSWKWAVNPCCLETGSKWFQPKGVRRLMSCRGTAWRDLSSRHMVLQRHMGPFVPLPGGLLDAPPCPDLSGAPGQASPGTRTHPGSRSKSLSSHAGLLIEGHAFALLPEHAGTSKSLAQPVVLNLGSLVFKLAPWLDVAGRREGWSRWNVLPSRTCFQTVVKQLPLCQDDSTNTHTQSGQIFVSLVIDSCSDLKGQFPSISTWSYISGLKHLIWRDF